jgi:hypothetical protein
VKKSILLGLPLAAALLCGTIQAGPIEQAEKLTSSLSIFDQTTCDLEAVRPNHLTAQLITVNPLSGIALFSTVETSPQKSTVSVDMMQSGEKITNYTFDVSPKWEVTLTGVNGKKFHQKLNPSKNLTQRVQELVRCTFEEAGWVINHAIRERAKRNPNQQGWGLRKYDI